jgi:hypothetical protein
VSSIPSTTKLKKKKKKTSKLFPSVSLYCQAGVLEQWEQSDDFHLVGLERREDSVPFLT